MLSDLFPLSFLDVGDAKAQRKIPLSGKRGKKRTIEASLSPAAQCEKVRPRTALGEQHTVKPHKTNPELIASDGGFRRAEHEAQAARLAFFKQRRWIALDQPSTRRPAAETQTPTRATRTHTKHTPLTKDTNPRDKTRLRAPQLIHLFSLFYPTARIVRVPTYPSPHLLLLAHTSLFYSLFLWVALFRLVVWETAHTTKESTRWQHAREEYFSKILFSSRYSFRSPIVTTLPFVTTPSMVCYSDVILLELVPQC